MPRATHAEINLDHLAANYRQIRRIAGPGCAVLPPVKANAYGHGAVAAARVLEAAGASGVSVATVEEGVELREAGIRLPVLLLGHVPEEDYEAVISYRLTPSIIETGQAAKLNETARRMDTRLCVHISVDTGLHRIGLDHVYAAPAIRCVAELANLRVTGIWTHFATSDAETLDSTNEQLDRFLAVVSACGLRGPDLPMLHACNSAGFLRLPRARMGGVRTGIITYGMLPACCGAWRELFRPVLSLKTRIVSIQNVRAGEGVGYGHTFRAPHDMVIATLPIGYHDGMLLQYSNRGQVLVRGRRAPVVGRVCMDQCMIDVSQVAGARVDDEVVIYGSQGDDALSIEKCAAVAGSIPYNLTCSIGPRVPRRYVYQGVAVSGSDLRAQLAERARSFA